MKKVLQLLLVGTLSISTVCANPGAAKHASSSMEDIKFGVIFKPYFSYLLRRDYVVDYLRVPCPVLPTLNTSVDLFGDFGFNSFLGVRVVLGYSSQGTESFELKKVENLFFSAMESYFVSLAGRSGGQIPWSSLPRKTSTIPFSYFREELRYLMLGIIPQVYIDSARQFCLCFGLRMSWLASAKIVFYDRKGKKTEEVNVLEVKDPYELKRIDWGILGGFNYEANYGLIIGLEGNLGLTNMLKKSPDKKDYLNTISLGINLGYNFAKLF